MVVTHSPFLTITLTPTGGSTPSFMSSPDPSQSEGSDVQPIALSTAGKVGAGILMSLVIFLSIFGNMLVCLAVCKDANLRKIGNLFVVSLAIADLFVACLVMTFALVNDILGYWPFGDKYCKIWISFDVMCSTASILFLCAISLDRYIHIKDPMRYSQWMTKKIVALSIAGICLVSALVSFLPISLDLHQPDRGDQQVQTVSNQCQMDLTPTFAIVSSSISFFLPCIVMLILYSKLYLYARKHVAAINSQCRLGMLGALDGDPNRPLRVSAPNRASDSKAATTVGIIVGTFLLCWVPFFCINIVAAFCKTCISAKVFKGLTWLGYTNSSFNPIIYSIFNKEFREAFRRILNRFFICCSSCRSNRIKYVSTAKSTALAVETRELRCCPAFSSCCSICSCYCFCCSWCCGPHDSPNRSSFHSKKKRSSASSEGGLHLPPRHENGSPSIVTEYRELDITPTPKIIYEKRQNNAHETQRLTEEISAI